VPADTTATGGGVVDRGSDPATLAADALRLVGVDARLADARAQAVVILARASGDRVVESTAWRARGLAARQLEELEQAESFLRRAVAVGRGADGRSTAEARMSLAFVLLERGKLPSARRLAALAVDALSGGEQPRARVQLALIQQRSGAWQEALDSYAQALRQLRKSGDRLWEARLRNNRGILLAYRAQPAAAERDLQRAAELYEGMGQGVMAAEARWNLGFAAGLRGDIVTALQRFEEAGAGLEKAGAVRGGSFLDQCLVLLSAGLLAEARAAIDAGIARLVEGGVDSDLAEARLLLAETLVAAGDFFGARSAATDALVAFESQGRPRHALLARYAMLQAATSTPDDEAWDGARATADALRLAGWQVPATDVMLMLARRNLARQQRMEVEEFDAAVRAARSGPVGQRMRAWHLVALARLSTGDSAGASRALLAGLRVLDRHRATLSATELQVRTAVRAGELAETGLRLAAEDGRPERLLAWAERWRAGSLLTRPVTAPKDDVLAGLLTELRGVAAELEGTRLEGGDVGRLERRQRALERAVTGRARTVRSDLTQLPIAGMTALFERLRDCALVEFVQLRDQLAAVVLSGHRSSLHVLANVSEIRQEMEALHFAHARFARGGSPRMALATKASLLAAAGRLDALLLEPLTQRLGDRQLVIVPTGEMHVLPWALLRHAHDVPVTVAPSASVWLASLERRREPRGPVVLVAGPGLTGATAEIQAVRAIYGDVARVLSSEEASVESVMRLLVGCSTAHLAAHGRFRSDNPLFSSLQMADGPITVYDLESLPTAPPVVVLSACDSGLSSVHPGDELMGLAGALLRMGTGSLVASVAPVPDDVASVAMVAFHAGLVGGASPAEALLAARSSLDEEARLRAAAFQCFGSG
jgi:CHAT domain-containing protein/tetratricopeptide (TPR) repeat protein